MKTVLAISILICTYSMNLSARNESFTVTLDPVEHGSISLDPPLPKSGSYPTGTRVSVKATPADGYSIDSIYYAVPGRWGAMYHESLTNQFEVIIDQNKHLGASFIETGEIDHISVQHDIVYAQPGRKKLKYDVYSPKDAANLPIVVIIHGGGWTSNDENVMRGLARELTRGGKLVACSIDYRWLGKLDGDETPNSMHQLVEDVFGAIAHIKEHAKEYGGDPRRIGVTGDSAGGHLSACASLLTWKIGTQGFGDTEGTTITFSPKSGFDATKSIFQFKPTYLPPGKSAEEIRDELQSSIKAAAPSYGIFAAEHIKKFVPDLSDAALQATAPLNHIQRAKTRKVPQYVTRGTKDSLIRNEHVSVFVDALKAKGQAVVYDQVEGAGHAFFDWKPNDEVKETFRKYGVPYAAKMRAFFEQHLGE